MECSLRRRVRASAVRKSEGVLGMLSRFARSRRACPKGPVMALLFGPRASLFGCFLVLIQLSITSCSPTSPTSQSLGSGTHGWLRHGTPLDRKHPNMRRLRPSEPTHFGTRELVGALETVADDLSLGFPGMSPLVVGDLSAPVGGQHPRHASHRSGRDVDLFFVTTEPRGVTIPPKRSRRFDRFGGLHAAGIAAGSGAEARIFSDLHNYAYARSLAAHLPVTWILVSAGLKQRLLSMIDALEEDPDLAEALLWVLHQPTRALPHDDHFHVRIPCTERAATEGCQENGPRWPWLELVRLRRTMMLTGSADSESEKGRAPEHTNRAQTRRLRQRAKARVKTRTATLRREPSR